jgi:lysozyme
MSVEALHPNLAAFLMAIRKCEGTSAPNGYRYLFGSRPDAEKLFWSFADHPRIRTYETNDEFIRDGKVEFTTSAGAYQLVATTYDALMRKFPGRWHGFNERVQDEMAIELIKECGAYDDVLAGRWQDAVRKCSRTWASLPTADTPQGRRSWQFVLNAYIDAGGQTTDA